MTDRDMPEYPADRRVLKIARGYLWKEADGTVWFEKRVCFDVRPCARARVREFMGRHGAASGDERFTFLEDWSYLHSTFYVRVSAPYREARSLLKGVHKLRLLTEAHHLL